MFAHCTNPHLPVTITGTFIVTVKLHVNIAQNMLTEDWSVQIQTEAGAQIQRQISMPCMLQPSVHIVLTCSYDMHYTGQPIPHHHLTAVHICCPGHGQA